MLVLQSRTVYICTMRGISRLISYLFHPLLFPTYGALFIILVNPNLYGYLGERIHMVWMIIVFALTFMFPVIWLAMMRGLQMIDSFQLQTAKDRIIPFIATATFYLWTTWMFKPAVNMKIPPNQLVFYMMIGASISIAMAFFINIFTKISLHAIGVGSFIGLVLTIARFSTLDLRVILIGAIVIAGVVGTARLVLGSHTTREIFMGYFVGFTGQFIAFGIVSKLL